MPIDFRAFKNQIESEGYGTMNKSAISKTALCHYDSRERCYIVRSPLFERCIGVGASEEEAFRIFNELLTEYYIAYLEGNLIGYEKRGRPTKGYVELHAQVKPSVKTEISLKAKELGISQGELIEYLCRLQDVKKDLEHRQVELKQQITKLQKMNKPR